MSCDLHPMALCFIITIERWCTVSYSTVRTVQSTRGVSFIPEYTFSATIHRMSEANNMISRGAVHNVSFCTRRCNDFNTGLLTNKDGVASFGGGIAIYQVEFVQSKQYSF